MVDKQKILDFVKRKGPILPVQLSNELKESTFITGALLSELVKSGHIKVSTVKVGGSPLYYVDEQKHKLQEYSDHLNEKDREAYEILKERLVLYDKELTPLLRVSLRKINDFAVPVKVHVNNNEELFWRWYLTPISKVEELLKKRFQQESQDNKTTTSDATDTKEETKIKEQEKNEEKTNTQKETTGEQQTQQNNLEAESSKQTNQETFANSESFGKEQQTQPKDSSKVQDSLQKMAEDFFKSNEIKVNSVKVIKKNKEIEFLIKVPSAIGEIDFFCRAKEKKKLNENDIANAFVSGQTKKRPVLLLITGELTKKAKESLHTEFTNVIVNYLS